MNGLKRAKILSYNAKGRTAQVHIHGLTDGASEGITATFAYPVGDSDLDTEIQIVDGEDVYVFFENGNEERPVIHSYVSHGDGAIVGVRRIRQDNIEFISKENLKVDSGTTVSIKTPLMNVQANTQQTGNSTLTGNSTVVGNTSVAGNSAVAGSMAVGTTLTVAGVPIDPKAIEGAFKDALDKLESLKEELKEQGEKIDENKDQVSQEIDEKIKEVEELIENIKDSDAYKLLEEGINHIDEEVQKIHDQVKEVGQIAQSKVDEVRAYIDQEIIDTKQIVEQHVSDANIRLDEANQRIDQSIQANEALVADAQQRAIRAEKELDDKIGFIKSETDSIIADVRSDADEIRLVAENAKKVADQEVLDRKKQAADTLIVIDQTKAALKQDIDQNLVKAGQMIDDAKLALGEETNTLINQKIEPIVNQTEAAVKKVDQVAAQYVDLDKKVDSGFLAEAEARANDKEALTKSFELKFAEMQTELGKSNALISEEIKTLAAQDRAFTEQISTAQSQIGDNKAAINNVERTVVDLGKSVAEKTDQIQASLDTTNASLLNATELARMQSLGKPLRDDPTFLSGNGGLSAYVVPSGSTFTRQAKSTDNPVNSTHEMLLRSTASLGGGWYPTVPTLVAAPNKTFLIKQIIKMPKGTYLLPVGNATGTGGYLRVLGNKEGTGKFEVYYSVVQCGYDAPAAIHGHFRVIAGTNPPLPSTTSPVDVILADYEVWDITALNDTIPKAWRDQITGNASYIEKVESSVKLVDEKLVSEAKKLEELKTDYNSNKTKTTSDLATIAQSVSDGDKALSLRIDQTKAALEEADRKSNANILEVTESLAEFEQSTTSKFSELDTSISKENLKVQGQITDVQKSVSTLESNTNTRINGLSSSLKTTDDIAKLALDNAAEAQQTGTTAVKATEALSQNLLSLKSQTQVTSGVRAIVTSKGIDDWTRWRTTGEAKVIQDADAFGGYILELGNNAGNDEAWVHWNEFVKINPDTLYRVRARFRRVAGESGTIYLGVACKNSDQSKYVTTTNTLAGDMGSSNYLLSAVKPNLGEWQEVVLYMKGKSTGAATGLGTIDNPRTFPAQAEYYAPMFIANYNFQTGICQLNYIIVEDNNSLASANDATATANDLFKTATNRTEAEAERTSKLESRMQNAETGIQSNAQALLKTATKSDLDSAMGRVATDITAAVNNIKIGGVNAVANSEAPRTSTAATSREYLMYERSKELKAFYDENLDKPVTISFEVSVPVAGTVQVYSSNRSAHFFTTSVTVTKASEFQKFEVTVFPKLHTGSTTESTIEFYGTYGTGRIPTIQKLQIEAGNKATAWSPSPRDTQSSLNANAEAIKVTQAEVKKHGDTLSSQSLDISKLRNDLTITNTEVSKKASTEALQTTNSQVSEQAGLIKAVTEQANTLSANLNKSAPAGTNLLINSNVVGTYNGVSYPHLRYKLGEDWEVGAKYTLLWCAEHTRGAGDTNSNLAVYAGGGSQFLQQVINTTGKVISKITFTKNSAGTAKEVHFYMLNKPTADKNSVGTVYWAVLVKGEFITTDNWIASPYDFNAAFDQVSANLNEFKQTYVTESGALAQRTSKLEAGMSDVEKNIFNTTQALNNYATNAKLDEVTASQTKAFNTSLTKLDEALKAANDSDSLAGDYNFKNPDMWYSHYGWDMSQYFKTTTTGKIGNTVFRKDTSNPVNCFNYNKQALPNTRAYIVSFLVRRSSDSNGLCYIPIGRAKNDGVFSTANYTSVSVPVAEIPANESWTLISKVINMTSVAETYPQIQLGIALGHKGNAGWWEAQAYRIAPVLNESDVDSTIVKSSILVDYSSKSDTTKAISAATESLEAKFRQKFGDLWTNSSATLDSTRYTKTETNQAIAEESKIIKAAISSSGGDNIIKNGDFSSPLGTLNWRQNSAVAGNLLEVYKDSKGATWGHFKSTDTTTYFKGFIETLTLADGLEMNQKYTLSFKAMSLTAAQTQILLIIHRRDSSGSNNQIGTTWNNISTDKETLCTYTFDTNIINLQHINLILYSQVGFAPDFLIREVQLEKGELATGFRKNPRELIKDLEANASAIEGTKADVQKNGEKITSLAENYATLKSTVDNNKTAVDGKFQEINSTISDNQQNTTQSINNLESSYKQLNQDLGQVFNYRVYSCGWNGFFTGIKNLKGEIKSVASARGFSVHVLAADGSIASSTRYDTYAAVANATAMSNAIAAIPNDTFVIVTNYDSIGVNLAPVKNALISLGANPFTLDQITGRDAYILVGQKGIGSGRGIELHATPDTGPIGAKQIMLAVQVVSGIPIGLANNSGNLQKVLENHAQILQEKITRSDAKEVFAEEIKVFKAQLDTLRYSEENWILLGDDTKNLSISTGTNRTVAVWELQYKHKEIPIDKGDPIVARIKYTATAGLVGATCSIQFHGATYSVGLPSFVVAASGEIELTGIFPSDLKASAFEAIPLGLRFDNAPSGGTFTVTNMFISRGNSAPNFKGGFRSSLKQNAQFVEDTFIKADVNKGVIAQQIQQYDATVPGGLSSVVKTTKATADQTSKDLATLRNTEISQLQTSTNNLGSALENTTMLAMMITNGKLLQGDVNFKKGNNGVSVYNNAGNGNVTVTRVAKSADNPTTSTYEIEIKTIGTASPTWGGFVQLVYGRANAVFVIKYLIKLPVGYKLVNAGNAMGTGAIDRFIGSTEGTGKFETYIRMIKCGAVGSFSNSGHVYVAGGTTPTATAPLVWTLAQIEQYDVTDYASADPTLQDFVSSATDSISTLTNFKETWAAKLTEMSSKLDSKNGAYILNADITNTNVERAIAASSQKITSEYTNAMSVQPLGSGGGKIFVKPLTWRQAITTSGTLVIKTPITVGAYMTKVKISGYNYNNKEDNIFDLDLAFYAYTSTVPFYPNMTSRSFGITLDENNATTKGLALALDSNNKVCILITKKDAWSYPAITVESATITHTNPPDYFKDGWTAAIETDLSVYKSVTPFTVTSMMETTAGSQAKVDVPMAQLSDIAADNKLTPVEKKQAKLVWDTLYQTDASLRAEAVTYGISSAAYATAFSTLNTYLASLFANMNVTSTIDRNQFITNFANVHNARQALVRAISEKAKEIADTAKDIASTTKATLERDYMTSTKTNEAIASSTERMSALYSANGQKIMASVLETWQKDWLVKTPSGNKPELSLVADATCRGGYALRIGNNVGNDEAWLNWFTSLPIDDNKYYRVKYRFRRVSGTGVVYVGATCQNANKTKYIAQDNSEINDIGSSHYLVAGTAPALGTWITGTAYFKGRSAGASAGAGTLLSPKTFANKAAFFTPVFIGNYSGKAGEVDLDFIDIEDADNIADFENFKTTYTTDVGAYAGALQTLVSVYGQNAIKLKSQADLIDGVKGKYVMGMDNNGVFSGMSMVSEQTNGTVLSSIGFQADRIFFTTGSSSTKYMPFIIQDNQVVMNSDVFIKNLTAANFKAKSLTAELFNVDKLSAITGELGTLITYKDPSQPQKARMVISGTALKLYDDNNIERIYIGL
ncbi:interleukin-like EMT inducer domain-containing protein [Acinetobacter baumannii]|uniref:interleukin-like EMT inducer domain-containing protein n=31 Tax=Acinetobacter baumannii TaxID=470 RepID=UPI0002BC63EE|nr:interleukin-like EMT inducer domain-containing protein [Acinetobacter baumannii]KRI02060.1 sugar-binding protein [Acinetobacter baumannii]KRI03573.1 sugar-binding protein [Acinetobacter baumannii]KRI71297.1 sugar-binding protein [Acinetobacter baumannii]KRI72705.1 sugar-binding protein [Acinetobacter baumannii]